MSLFRGLATGLVLLGLSIEPSNAAIISYAGYTHDDTTNVVVGDGLEWLQWTATRGMSVDIALDTYASEGWELASNVQMAELFNNFGFGGIVWDSLENTGQSVSTGNDAYIELPDDPDLLFVTMFGNSSSQSWWSVPSNPIMCSKAYYGKDLDTDGRINFAQVCDDYYDITFNSHMPGTAEMSADWHPVYDPIPNTVVGVALVRSHQTVPEPATLALMSLGLVGLGFARRQRKQA